jgi:hypothetical protein
MNRVIEGLSDRVLRPYRDHHCEALEARFGQKPQRGRMSAVDHTRTYSTPRHHVWNAAMTGHSGANVGHVALFGPRIARSRRSRKCQEPKLIPSVDSPRLCDTPDGVNHHVHIHESRR